MAAPKTNGRVRRTTSERVSGSSPMKTGNADEERPHSASGGKTASASLRSWSFFRSSGGDRGGGHYRKNGVVSRDAHGGVVKAAALARTPSSSRSQGLPTSTRSQGQVRATKSQGSMKPVRSKGQLKATKSQGQLPATRGRPSSSRAEGQSASSRPIGRSPSRRQGQSPSRRPPGPSHSARPLGRNERPPSRGRSRRDPAQGYSDHIRDPREQGRRSPPQVSRKASNGRMNSVHPSNGPKEQPQDFPKERDPQYTAEESRMLDHALQHYRNGNALCREEFFDEAILEYKKAVMIREPIVGKYHLDTASLYWYIGNCYYAKGDYDNALMAHHRWLRIRRHLNQDVSKPGIMWIIGPLQKKGLSDDQIKAYDENLKMSLIREREGDELRDKRSFKAAILKYKEAITFEKKCFGNGLHFEFMCPHHGVHHPCP